MMPVLDELELQRAFNSFCKKLLRNEAINAIVALQRRKNTVLNFSDINFDEEVMVGSYDRTIDPDTEYLVQGRKISNAQLIKANNQLAEPYRKVIEYKAIKYNDIIDEIKDSQYVKPIKKQYFL